MFLDPKSILDEIDLSTTNVAIDLGTGSGAWALLIAERLAGGGVVYGVDIQEDILTRLSHTAKEAHLSNIIPVHANIEKVKGVPLRDGIADFVVISNVLYCADDREGVLAEAARLCRNGGQMLLIDWTGPHKGMGPEINQVVTQANGEQLAAHAGFEKVSSILAGAYHWAKIFSRKPSARSGSKFAI